MREFEKMENEYRRREVDSPWPSKGPTWDPEDDIEAPSSQVQPPEAPSPTPKDNPDPEAEALSPASEPDQAMPTRSQVDSIILRLSKIQEDHDDLKQLMMTVLENIQAALSSAAAVTGPAVAAQMPVAATGTAAAARSGALVFRVVSSLLNFPMWPMLLNVGEMPEEE